MGERRDRGRPESVPSCDSSREHCDQCGAVPGIVVRECDQRVVDGVASVCDRTDG